MSDIHSKFLHRIAAAAALLGSAALLHAAPVVPNLVYHLDASDPLDNGGSSLPSDNTGVTTWANIAAGSSLPDATAPSGAPTWLASAGPNSTPVFRLSNGGAAYFKSTTTNGFDFLHNGSNHTVFIVFRTALADPYLSVVLDSGVANTFGAVGYAMAHDDREDIGSDATLAGGIGNGTDSVVRYSSFFSGPMPDGVTPPATWKLVSTAHNANLPDGSAPTPEMIISVNAYPVFTAVPGLAHSGASGTGGGLTIGAAYSGAFLLDGYVSELMIYDRRLNAVEQVAVNDYLMTKYALPEPTSMALLLAGGSLLAMRRRA